MSDQARAVVVGGGIAGLVAALLLAERHHLPVTLIEREAGVGGLLRCFDYGEYGRFDYGMHNMFETGIPELDDLLWRLLPDPEWQVLAGDKRDLAGLFFGGRLQTNSLYMDLRGRPARVREQYLEEVRKAIKQPQSPAKNAVEYARGRFGEAIAETVLSPVLRKLYRRSPQDLAVLATQITMMDRVILLSEADMARADAHVRARIAFPDQRRLPAHLASGRRGYYPKRYGIYRVIEALERRLHRAGVEILCGATLKAVRSQSGQIVAVECDVAGELRTIQPVSLLCWTTGLPGIASLLGAMPKNLPFDRPLRTVVVNFLLRRSPEMADLYYFYCYDDGFSTLRVTNYSAYCEGAARQGGYPVCVELLEPDDGNLAPLQLADRARTELEAFGVLRASNEVVFSKAEILTSGFPMPTVKNIASMDQVRDSVSQLGLRNLLTLGILSERDLFFQRDVLAHVYKKVEGWA